MAACSPNVETILSLTTYAQETSEWCWAASGETIMADLGHGVAQSQLAHDDMDPKSEACSSTFCDKPPAIGDPCVHSGWPDFEKHGFSSQHTTSAALTWDEIKQQLSDAPNCGHTPFAMTWKWPGGGGHMMVVKGYSEVDGEKYVYVFDPWWPCVGAEVKMPYDYYVQEAGHHTHWNDYYGVRYTGTKT